MKKFYITIILMNSFAVFADGGAGALAIIASDRMNQQAALQPVHNKAAATMQQQPVAQEAHTIAKVENAPYMVLNAKKSTINSPSVQEAKKDGTSSTLIQKVAKTLHQSSKDPHFWRTLPSL